MLQENSARKEDLPSTAAPFFDSSSTTVVSGDLGTFSRAIVVEAPGYVLGRAVHSAFSFAAHFAAVIAIVWFWPLTFPQKPFLFAMSQQFVTVPFAPPARSPRAKFSFSSRSFADPFLSLKLAGPVRKFAKPRPTLAAPEEIPPLSLPQATGGWGAVLGGIVNDASRPAAVSVLPLDISPDAQILRAGGEIKVSRLIERVSFDYPEIAKMAHIFGRVVIAAVIDETGKVTQAHLVSGPGLLASSAIEALSRERFQPTLLDGQPIKCDLVVRVRFRLAGWDDDGPW